MYVRICSPYGASDYETAVSFAEYHLHMHCARYVSGDGVKIKHLPFDSTIFRKAARLRKKQSPSSIR